jgi:hypothetical protein
MYTQQLEDDQETNSDASTSDVEYTFEGFTIELNQKIMLTPLVK